MPALHSQYSPAYLQFIQIIECNNCKGGKDNVLWKRNDVILVVVACDKHFKMLEKFWEKNDDTTT